MPQLHPTTLISAPEKISDTSRNLLCSRLFGQLVRQPIETLIESLAGSRTRSLNVPVALAERVETQFVCDICCIHCIRQILLVGKDKKHSIPKLIFVQHAMELITGFSCAVPVVRIDNKDQSLCILEIMTPQRSDFVLSADIPNSEIDILVFNGFNVEADSWDCGHNLAQLKLVQNRGLSCSIQPHHKDTHLLLGEEPLENTPEVPHLDELI
mmetsp:Transcript_54123/g.113146  ORF Transcript_54123/g.113146 Transcript_54123/m.113146 type:complete len:212 (-) Transcript_54123:114-749(-)